MYLSRSGRRVLDNGCGPEQAAQRADLTIATLEGALVLARARQNADVLREAGRQLGPLLRPPED